MLQGDVSECSDAAWMTSRGVGKPWSSIDDQQLLGYRDRMQIPTPHQFAMESHVGDIGFSQSGYGRKAAGRPESSTSRAVRGFPPHFGARLNNLIELDKCGEESAGAFDWGWEEPLEREWRHRNLGQRIERHSAEECRALSCC